MKSEQSWIVETIQDCRALRSASLEQARALRAAIPRQTSASVVDLMRGEIERLERVAAQCRCEIDRLERLINA